MFKHILIPLDFTEKNDPAIEIAREMAVSTGARVTLLHVIKAIEGVPADEIREFYDMLTGRARKMLSRLQTDLTNREVATELAIAFGKRSEEIVRFAAEGAVDLILMSSRVFDPDSPTHPWPTVSHKVAVLATCPILLVKAP